MERRAQSKKFTTGQSKWMLLIWKFSLLSKSVTSVSLGTIKEVGGPPLPRPRFETETNAESSLAP
jgi:hypothetical protein